VEGAGAKASRLFWQRFRTFFESLPIPADASGAYRPDLQATTKPAPGPPVTEGLQVPVSGRKKEGAAFLYRKTKPKKERDVVK